jgi:hypothetical protein
VIYVWRHVATSLRFNPPPPSPGLPRPKPGGPLKLLFLCFFAAPVAFRRHAVLAAQSRMKSAHDG